MQGVCSTRDFYFILGPSEQLPQEIRSKYFSFSVKYFFLFSLVVDHISWNLERRPRLEKSRLGKVGTVILPHHCTWWGGFQCQILCHSCFRATCSPDVAIRRTCSRTRRISCCVSIMGVHLCPWYIFFPTTFIQFLSFLSTLDYFPAIFFIVLSCGHGRGKSTHRSKIIVKKYGKFWTFYQNFRLPLLLSTSKGLLATHSVWRKDLGEINVILSGRYISYIFAFLHVFFLCIFKVFQNA